MNKISGTHKGTSYLAEELAEGGVKLIRKSPFTGKLTEHTINTTLGKLAYYYAGHGLIQNIFPELSADDREFIMTGITPQDWDSTFGEED